MKKVLRQSKKFWVIFWISSSILILIKVSVRSYDDEVKQVESWHRNRLVYNVNVKDDADFLKCPNALKPAVSFYHKEFWQILKTESIGLLTMFNAYYDAREHLRVHNESWIRIVAFVHPKNPQTKLFCQLWFDGIDDVIVSEVHEYLLMWPDGWELTDQESPPYLVSCKNPLMTTGLVPASVSLVERQCDNATNFIDINYNRPETERLELAICTKLYDYKDDRSIELVEWIETQLILGVAKIIFHVRDVNREMMKVLRFYEQLGKVDIESMTTPDGLDAQWMKNEMIGFNDCLYKNMYRFKYLLPIDVDEIIVPTRTDDKTLLDLMHKRLIPMALKMNPNGVINNMFQNAFFLIENDQTAEVQPGVPANSHFLQHIFRAASFAKPGIAVKSIVNADWVTVLFNHQAIRCFYSCNTLEVPPDEGKLQHYRRNGCGEGFTDAECQDFRLNTMKDATLLKYKDEIISNVKESIGKLKNFEKIWNAVKNIQTCPGHKKPPNITFQHDHWQVFNTVGIGSYRMLNAYYDSRKYLKYKNQAFIRIMALVQPPNVFGTPKPFCQLWFDGIEEPVTSMVDEYLVLYPHGWGLDGLEALPYLVTCKNPLISDGLKPTAVSLVECKCDTATNLFEVIYDMPENGDKGKKDLAICTKLFDYKDNKVVDFEGDKMLELVEWIESQLILGVDKIIVYIHDAVNQDTMKVLKFYEKQGSVDIELVTMPSDIEVLWKKKDSVVFNDCLYKNMYRYKLLMPLEVNEIIVPILPDHRTLLDYFNGLEVPGYIFKVFSFHKNFFFSINEHKEEVQPEVPKSFYFLKQIYRAINQTKPSISLTSVLNPDYATAIYDHCVIRCFEDCEALDIPDEQGKLQRYIRNGCGDDFTEVECQYLSQNTINDTSLWKNKNEIVANVKKAVEDLKVFKEQ